jgi:hypothetical protein
MTTSEVFESELRHAEAMAWDALSRYDFQMFGCWALAWETLRQAGRLGRLQNPWHDLVVAARNRDREKKLLTDYM